MRSRADELDRDVAVVDARPTPAPSPTSRSTSAAGGAPGGASADDLDVQHGGDLAALAGRARPAAARAPARSACAS